MRQRRLRSGFTLIEWIVVIVLLGGLAFWVWTVQAKVNQVDEQGRALRTWAASTDDPAVANYTGPGLSAYLRSLSEKISTHIGQKVTPAGPAHTGVHDSHLDPPPPPPW